MTISKLPERPGSDPEALPLLGGHPRGQATPPIFLLTLLFMDVSEIAPLAALSENRK